MDSHKLNSTTAHKSSTFGEEVKRTVAMHVTDRLLLAVKQQKADNSEL